MADPTDIELKLKTTGDTSGAEAVEKSIFAVEDAAKDASRQADVDIVKGKQAAEVQKQQAEALREVVDLQQRIVAAQLAQAIGKVSEQFKGLSPEVDMAITAGENFLNVFATTGDPIKATLALTATAIGGVVTAYREAAEQTKQIAKTEQENLKHTAELRAAFAAQLRTEGLVAFFKKETDELEEQEKVLNRIVKINASERALAAQQQATAGAAAVAGGASAAGVTAQQQGTSTDNAVAALKEKLAQSQQAVEIADKAAGTLELAAKALVQNQGEGGKEALAATAAAEAARTKAEELRKDEAANQVVILNEMQAANSAGKQAVEKTGQEGLAALKEGVEKERDALQKEVTNQGIHASSNAKTALEEFSKVLADGQITADELKLLADAQNRVRGSQEAMNTAVKEGFDETATALDAVLSIIRPVLNKIAAQGAEIADLRAQISTLYY